MKEKLVDDGGLHRGDLCHKEDPAGRRFIPNVALHELGRMTLVSEVAGANSRNNGALLGVLFGRGPMRVFHRVARIVAENQLADVEEGGLEAFA